MSEMKNKKVLFVCAQGKLRSATCMHFMNRLYGWNTRAAGVDADALIPITAELIKWADDIYVMESYMEGAVQEIADDIGAFIRIRVLNIPDDYNYMEEELCGLVQRRVFSAGY